MPVDLHTVPGCVIVMSGRNESSLQRRYTSQSLKYLLSDPLQKKFAEPSYSGTHNTSVTLGFKEIKSQNLIFLLTTYGTWARYPFSLTAKSGVVMSSFKGCLQIRYNRDGAPSPPCIKLILSILMEGF